MTKDVIAKRMDMSTGSVSVLLKRLVDSGCAVACRTEHVNGARMRRTIHLTTPKGDTIAEY